MTGKLKFIGVLAIGGTVYRVLDEAGDEIGFVHSSIPGIWVASKEHQTWSKERQTWSASTREAAAEYLREARQA